ncbi:hypothetical protein D3C87_2058350 [compost metagenome]
MRLIKEEHDLWFIQIARFRQLFIEFREHPQKAGGVELWHLVKLLGAQNVDDPFVVTVGAHPVFDIQHRLAKEMLCALLFEG